MIDRRYIGHVFPPFSTIVEAGRVRLFCKAIGETAELHSNARVARSVGYRDILAPVTFPTAIAMDNPHPRCVYELLELRIEWILHGEENYEFGAPICVGDEITAQLQITDIYDKKNGAMEFVAVAIGMRNQLREEVCAIRRLLIVRRSQPTADRSRP
jgi:acyl dehydratase